MADEPQPPNPSADDAASSADSNLIDQAELDALVKQLEQADSAKPQAASAGPVAPAQPAGAAAQPAAVVSAAQTPVAEPATPMAVSDQPAEAPAPVEPVARPAVLGAQVRTPPTEAAAPLEVPDLARAAGQDQSLAIDLLDDVELDVKVELGRAQMYIEDVLRLGEGSVIELDKLAGDPVDIYVNERLMARGEVLVLNENFCVRINDIMSPDPEAGDSK